MVGLKRATPLLNSSTGLGALLNRSTGLNEFCVNTDSGASVNHSAFFVFFYCCCRYRSRSERGAAKRTRENMGMLSSGRTLGECFCSAGPLGLQCTRYVRMIARGKKIVSK